MNTLRILGLAFLVTSFVASAAEVKTHQPVAIVYSLTGEASVAAPGAARRPLRLFDRLPPGTTLEVGRGARLALAFVNGLRYELGEGSRATLGPKGLASHFGPVRSLPTVPTKVLVKPIAAGEGAGKRSPAIPIRGERIAELYPRRGARVLAGEIVLRFEPVSGASRYRVEVNNAQGGIVFRTEIESPPVKVPAGTLRAGRPYRWTVSTLDRPGAVATGAAEFTILSEEISQAREKAREILEAESPESLPLLAQIDRSLGLWLEARKDLQAALNSKPGDPDLQKALTEVEGWFEHEAPKTKDDLTTACPFSTPGVVVETVTPESAAFRAGLIPGDRCQKARECSRVGRWEALWRRGNLAPSPGCPAPCQGPAVARSRRRLPGRRGESSHSGSRPGGRATPDTLVGGVVAPR